MSEIYFYLTNLMRKSEMLCNYIIQQPVVWQTDESFSNEIINSEKNSSDIQMFDILYNERIEK